MGSFRREVPKAWSAMSVNEETLAKRLLEYRSSYGVGHPTVGGSVRVATEISASD